MHWRQNPQGIAWIILIGNFIACCMLAVAVPLGLRSFVLHSTRPEQTWLAATAGTVQLQAAGAREPAAVTERRPVTEGSLIVTDNTAQALLTIAADESGAQIVATIQMLQDTTLRLERARTPRFGLSSDPNRIVLELVRGRALIRTQSAGGRGIQAVLSTPHGRISFGVGAFDVLIEGQETQVRARAGVAHVLAANTEVTVNSGERSSIIAGRPPSLPVPGALNLVLNGEFGGNLAPAWRQVIETEPGREPGEITTETDGARRAVRFTRRTEDGAPNRVGVQQILDRDVQGYESLALRFDLLLRYQSVPGGGYLASEYPVMVDIQYTDVYGNKDLHWYQGFYYLDLPTGSPWKLPAGHKIPLGVWYTFESPNLFERLRDNRPARINSITIYASGHDYESLIADVALLAR